MDTETMSIILSTSSFILLLYLAGTQAAGAGVYTLRCTVNKCLYSSDIRFPSSVGTSVGVGNLDAEGYVLSANFTFSHLSAPP